MSHMSGNHCLSQDCNVETTRNIACNRVCAMRHMFMHSLYLAHIARPTCHATCFSVIYLIFICDTSRNHLCSRNVVSSLLDILLATNFASCKISFERKTRRRISLLLHHKKRLRVTSGHAKMQYEIYPYRSQNINM